MPDDHLIYPLTGRFLEGRLRHAMSETDKQMLEDLVGEEELLDSGRAIARRGELCTHSTMLVEGFLLRTITDDGTQYVVGAHVPGDFVDLHSFALKRLDHDVVTVGRTRLAYVSHERLAQVLRENARLARIMWFASLLDGAIHRAWILKLEQLRADERIAHLFAELWCRLDMVGLARPDGFATPFSQTHLAGMCGISVVHANRALGMLKTDNIAQFRRGRLFAEDRAALEARGRFAPDYLYGESVLQMEAENEA